MAPVSHIPKGPFRTKNAISMEIVVFCYRVVFHYLYRFAVIFPRKNSIEITLAVVNYYRSSELLSP